MLRILIALLLLALWPSISQAQTTEQKLLASDGAQGDVFGSAVFISGGRLLVGAHHKNDLIGAAYVYERLSDGSWLEVAKLTASDGDTGDSFGRSVALSGDLAMFGTYHDEGAAGETSAGSAYIFERQGDGSWLEVAKLMPSAPETGGLFGRSISFNGSRALVGASGGPIVPSTGSAYVFEREANGTWVELARLTASDGELLDLFGWSVALSPEGDMAFVSATDHNQATGAVYVFEEQTNGQWLEIGKLEAGDGAGGDRFGFSISLEDDQLAVGATQDDDLGDGSGSTYVFERQEDGSWLEVVKLTASDGAGDDNLGFSVDLDGEALLVGAHFDDDRRGSAYLFERQPDGSWEEVHKFVASDGESFDRFGRSVSHDRDRYLIGAQHDTDFGLESGSAYVFDGLPAASLQVSCSPINPPIILPPNGGVYSFNLVVMNAGLSAESIDVWFEVVGPGINRLVGPIEMTLPAGGSIERVLNQRIPAAAAPGNYTQGCMIGAFPEEVASSGFAFQKSGGIGTEQVQSLSWTEVDEFASALAGPASATSAADDPSAPAILGTAPNPFNPTTVITYRVQEPGPVELAVFDVLGRRVAVLVAGPLEAGTHTATFNATGLPTGTYVVRFVSGETVQTSRLTLVK